ncbi:hypothetical protein J2W22_001338 [Sphingomonas kyeonggiensis]|uniref:hypothetical protein n=1 Tax=Sphingomonas kyeonggiensis TaxID=1268553 RepID=UPI00278B700C|nr:hypothetical protein [Sphingomonas kyeonggiensis]MDQ0249291.1 hypothetical protein [Sphingomonas kyeonggiensis]
MAVSLRWDWGRDAMKGRHLLLVGALAMLAACAASHSGKSFTIPASEITTGWTNALYREMARAAEDGTDPSWNIVPSFSDARCRWTVPGREAMCRYTWCSRLHCRPQLTGSEPEHRTTRTEHGWDFGL